MIFDTLGNIYEWFSELTTFKKVLWALPVGVSAVAIFLWAFAKFCANPEKTSEAAAKKVRDEEIADAKKRDEQLEQNTELLKKEIKSMRKHGEINNAEFDRYKTDLIDAGFDISRINALLARAREHRRNRKPGGGTDKS